MCASIVRYHLKQETPMWHFQSREQGGHQKGATLRGSDVKPRLDQFLIRQMKKEGIAWEKFRISEDHDALNYQIQIVALGECDQDKDMGKKAFFANMGPGHDGIKTVYYPDGINIKITCFTRELLDEIEKHLPGFFLIHNFGTRQDKGFGGFSVDKKDNCKIGNDINKVLSTYAESEGYAAYEIDLSDCTDKDHVLDNAYILYQWMKSGINYGNIYKKALLTEYMWRKDIQGEKAWMKENGIAPKVCTDEKIHKIVRDTRTPEKSCAESKYIRSVLGVSGNQMWLTDQINDYNNKNKRVTISVLSDEIARFQSPITIKYIDKKVYFIVYDLRKEPFNILFDKEFLFRNYNKKKSLKTPIDFDIYEFMDYCRDMCIEECSDKTFKMKGIKYGYKIRKTTS